jgi:hypothetical protein
MLLIDGNVLAQMVSLFLNQIKNVFVMTWQNNFVLLSSRLIVLKIISDVVMVNVEYPNHNVHHTLFVLLDITCVLINLVLIHFLNVLLSTTVLLNYLSIVKIKLVLKNLVIVQLDLLVHLTIKLFALIRPVLTMPWNVPNQIFVKTDISNIVVIKVLNLLSKNSINVVTVLVENQ